MEITKEIYQAHEKLSASSAGFLDFVKNNPESLKRSNFSDLSTGDPLLTLQPWPTFIAGKTIEEFREAGVKVCNLIKSVPQRFFSNSPGRIGRYYEMPPQMADTLLKGVESEHINNLLGRGDFIYSSAGLKCLEYNISGNVGGWEVDMWEDLYLKNPIISHFLQHHAEPEGKPDKNTILAILFKHLTDTALAKFPGIGDSLKIVLVVPLVNSDDNSKFLLSRLNKMIAQTTQMPVSLCSYHDLKIVNNRVYHRGERVHILVEQCGGIVPPDFVKTVRTGNVIIYNGSITGLMSNKFNLAVLSENLDSDVFSGGERETIGKYIPWTRKVVPGKTTYAGKPIDLAPFMYSQRERLIIKPAVGFGGKSVYVGKYMTQSRWQEVVNTSFKNKRWLVQEYVESLPFLYQSGENGCVPHHAVWGFFIFGSTYAGAWLRVLPREGNSGVINSHQGAEESVVLEMQSR